jgi:transcriptional regulator with XRE-family HTH domain
MASLRAIVAKPRLEGSDDLDVMVGHRLRALRLQRGLSRRALGAAIGVSVAEIGQFEDGLTRVGAARLMRLAEALEVHISAFFDHDRAALCAETANPS